MSDIDTYAGLVAFVTDHLELDADTVAQLPNLIRLAELKLNRVLLPATREVSATASTTADVGTLALPSGFRQIRSISISGGNALAAANLNEISRYQDNGEPQVFAVSGSSLHFGPVPDDAYTLSMIYLADIAPLTATNTTNWLIEENPDAYVYATLAEAEAFRANMDAAQMWNGQLAVVIDEINRQGLRYRNAAPIRLRSTVVV